jgi:hypothetical protein
MTHTYPKLPNYGSRFSGQPGNHFLLFRQFLRRVYSWASGQYLFATRFALRFVRNAGVQLRSEHGSLATVIPASADFAAVDALMQSAVPEAFKCIGNRGRFAGTGTDKVQARRPISPVKYCLRNGCIQECIQYGWATKCDLPSLSSLSWG